MTTYKYENQKWVPYIDTDEFTDDIWSLEVVTFENQEYLLISCSKILSCDQYEYDCQYENSRLKISALDDRNEIIGKLDLLFDNGKWIVESSQ